MNKKIQVLRGLAIIAVLLIHSYPTNILGIFIRVFVNYAVAMFLFCSGYLTKTSYPSVWKFYKKRLTRVLVPYAIWSLAYTLAFAVRDGAYSGLFRQYIYNLIYGTANSTMYFVVVYVLLILWTPLITRLAVSRYKWIGWLFTPLYMILTTYIPLLFGRSVIPNAITPFLRLQWFHFYYLGIMLGNHLIHYGKNKKQTIWIYGFTLLVSLAEGLYWNHLGNYSMATTQAKLSCLLSSSFACILAYVYLEDSKQTGSTVWEKKLEWIGNYSFGIYLMHIMVMGVLKTVPGYDSLLFPLNTLLIFFLTVAGLQVIEKVFKGKANRLLGIR